MLLDPLLASPVEPTTKGWPAHVGPLPLGGVSRLGWSLLAEDLPLPVAALRSSALGHNSRWMRGFIEHFDVRICPHGKTTMAPQLFARQLADGAWGITVATAQQALVCRRFGVPRVLMANQLVGQQNIRAVLRELKTEPAFEFICLVDSIEGIEQLAGEARSMGLAHPVRVLLEGGTEGGRTGCRTLEQGLAVARAAAAAPELALIGIEAFEDVLRVPQDRMAAAIEGFLGFLVELAGACAKEDLFAPGPVVLSAGGSKYFDLVTRVFRAADLGREVEVVLRSGCYLTHDSMLYTRFFETIRERTPQVDQLGEGLRPAIEIWAYVQSTPEPGLAFATMGRRDVSFDADLPVPLKWFRPGLHERPQTLGEGFSVSALNDQHAFVRMPEDSPLGVGDMVAFGISHPCTTFDKWQLLYVVDDDYRIIEAIRTFF